MKRRDFFKTIGVGSSVAALGASPLLADVALQNETGAPKGLLSGNEYAPNMLQTEIASGLHVFDSCHNLIAEIANAKVEGGL